MSLLFPEYLGVFFSPHHVVAGTLVKRFHKLSLKPVAFEELNDQQSPDPQADVLQTLGELLKGTGRRSGRLRVLVSNSFVRYNVLAWRPGLSSHEEYRALARAEFAENFGDMVKQWQIEVSDEPPGRPRVGLAIDGSLMKGIRDVVEAAGWRLDALTTFSAAVASSMALRRRCPSWAWLLVHEPGRLGIIMRDSAGMWSWVRHFRIDGQWASRIRSMLESESLVAGVELRTDDVILFGPFMTREEDATVRAQGIRLLDPDHVYSLPPEFDRAGVLPALQA